MSKSGPRREKFAKSIRDLLLEAGFDESEVAIQDPTERGPDVIVTAREKHKNYKILIQYKWAKKRKTGDVKQKDKIVYWDDNDITYYRRMIGRIGKPYIRHIILKRFGFKIPIEKAYFHSIKYSFPLSLFLFLVSVCAGYSLSEQFPVGMLEMFREIFVGIEKWHKGLWLMTFIFLNNSVRCLLVILFGFIFGIVPLLFVAINGFILGLEIEGLGLAATLPHGVIEIPMVLLSSAIGIRIGYEAMNKMRGKGSIEEELRRGIRFFALPILPLLLLAAIIEAFLTPFIIHSLL